MKGIYLGACRAYHKDYDIDYNDIVSGYHINIVCDMMQVDLLKYDYIIASPPCNYYSRANYRRDESSYALNTKHLLPDILIKCAECGKPFIVENVRSPRLFKMVGIDDICNKYGIIKYYVGRHTYFTNLLINLSCKQELDFHNYLYAKKMGIKTERQEYRQGGDNVHRVIEIFLKYVVDNNK